MNFALPCVLPRSQSQSTHAAIVFLQQAFMTRSCPAVAAGKNTGGGRPRPGALGRRGTTGGAAPRRRRRRRGVLEVHAARSCEPVSARGARLAGTPVLRAGEPGALRHLRDPRGRRHGVTARGVAAATGALHQQREILSPGATLQRAPPKQKQKKQAVVAFTTPFSHAGCTASARLTRRPIGGRIRHVHGVKGASGSARRWGREKRIPARVPVRVPLCVYSNAFWRFSRCGRGPSAQWANRTVACARMMPSSRLAQSRDRGIPHQTRLHAGAIDSFAIGA